MASRPVTYYQTCMTCDLGSTVSGIGTPYASIDKAPSCDIHSIFPLHGVACNYVTNTVLVAALFIIWFPCILVDCTCICICVVCVVCGHLRCLWAPVLVYCCRGTLNVLLYQILPYSLKKIGPLLIRPVVYYFYIIIKYPAPTPHSDGVIGSRK